MLHTFYRQDLFDLVWSEATRTIAKRLGRLGPTPRGLPLSGRGLSILEYNVSDNCV